VKKEKPKKGRAKFIHKLREVKTSKADALTKTQAKFDCSPSLFERIWERGAKGATKPKAEKAKDTKRET